jgi:uncharacterized membrane protein YozB (DUF420 family)
MDYSILPTVNASLNATSTVLLVAGWVFMKRREISRHRACMIGACVVSAAFLASYLVYHANVGSVPYTGQGVRRTLYFLILITHVILAAFILPLALMTLTRGLRGQFMRHRAIARWTFPIWLYVSVTGVVIYAMLYGV